MADDTGEWAPKTRDDWTGLFKDAFTGAQKQLQSEKEEEEAKRAAAEAASSTDKTGESGAGDANSGAKTKRSFADRLLGG